MAKVTAGKRSALRMDDLGINLDGTVVPSSTNVRISYGNGDFTDFGGTFTFLPGGQFTGTVRTVTHVVSGKTVFSVSGASADAQTLFALIDSGDILGAQAYVLRADDKISGNGLGDVLYGFDGDDTLVGKGGNDVLVGGKGRDSLNGGKGADRFGYWSTEDSGTTLATRDTIFGFNHAEGDRIDLSRIDANENTTRNDKFRLVDAFTGKAGELTIREGGAGWVVSGDTDGKDGADFTILVKTDVPLVSGDFIL
jgi:Ca2+-binding RTX toxin-like protein